MCSKYWCFTLNNPRDNNAEDQPNKWKDVKYLIYQKEKGENGTIHFQGYVVFNHRKKAETIKKMSPRTHWEVRKGTHQDAKTYVTKQPTKIDGPWEQGDDSDIPNGQGQRNDLLTVKRALDAGASEEELVEEHFVQCARHMRFFRDYRRIKARQRSWKSHVVVLWGPTGTGKSRYATENYPGAYWKPQGDWWDGYEGQETVVIDEFYGWLSYSIMLRLLDRYPLIVGTKGGHANFAPRTIVITSNRHPIEWYNTNKHPYPPLERRIDQILHFSTPYLETDTQPTSPETVPATTTTTTTTTSRTITDLTCDEEMSSDEEPLEKRPPTKSISRVYHNAYTDTLMSHLEHGYQSPLSSPYNNDKPLSPIRHTREEIRAMQKAIDEDDSPMFNLFYKK